MTDTDSDSAYIREVTDYFCALAGTVSMISSQDEHLLMRWRRDGISKQDVLMGIKKAFETGAGMKKIKISSCSKFVEERLAVAPLHSASGREVHSAITAVSVSMAKALSRTTDTNVCECIKRAHASFADSAGGAEDLWGLLKRTRSGLCEDLMGIMEPGRADAIRVSAREKADVRKFINDRERKKAVEAYVEEFVMRESGLEDLFSLSGEDSVR